MEPISKKWEKGHPELNSGFVCRCQKICSFYQVLTIGVQNMAKYGEIWHFRPRNQVSNYRIWICDIAHLKELEKLNQTGRKPRDRYFCPEPLLIYFSPIYYLYLLFIISICWTSGGKEKNNCVKNAQSSASRWDVVPRTSSPRKCQDIFSGLFHGHVTWPMSPPG